MYYKDEDYFWSTFLGFILIILVFVVISLAVSQPWRMLSKTTTTTQTTTSQSVNSAPQSVATSAATISTNTLEPGKYPIRTSSPILYDGHTYEVSIEMPNGNIETIDQQMKAMKDTTSFVEIIPGSDPVLHLDEKMPVAVKTDNPTQANSQPSTNTTTTKTETTQQYQPTGGYYPYPVPYGYSYWYPMLYWHTFGYGFPIYMYPSSATVVNNVITSGAVANTSATRPATSTYNAAPRTTSNATRVAPTSPGAPAPKTSAASGVNTAPKPSAPSSGGATNTAPKPSTGGSINTAPKPSTGGSSSVPRSGGGFSGGSSGGSRSSGGGGRGR